MNRRLSDDAFDARWPTLAIVMVACGLLINSAVLLTIGVQQQGGWPAAATPFAVPSVLIVHLLSVVPLSLWCSRALINGTGVRRFRRRWGAVAACVALGLVAAAASWLAGSELQSTARLVSTGRVETLRLLWSALIMLPWCAAAVLVWFPPRPAGGDPHADPAERSSSDRSSSNRKGRAPRLRGWLFCADGVIAVLLALLPIVHVQQVIERKTALLTDAAVNQQYGRAAQICEQLADLGTPSIAGQPTEGLLAELRGRVDDCAQQVKQPLPAEASDAERIARAQQLYSLGRLDDVRALLSDLPRNARAQQRLALTEEAQGNYRRAAEGYRRAIELLPTNATLSSQDLSLLRSSLERRANNLRRAGESRRAEAELLDALDRWPQARDAVLMQLGFHYQMAGRTHEAIEFFQQAAAANPRLEPQADAAVAQLQTQAEGCLLRSTRGAAR